MIIYIAIIMIDGQVETAGAYRDSKSATRAAKTTLTQWLEADGYEPDEIKGIIANAASGDGTVQYWVDATPLN